MTDGEYPESVNRDTLHQLINELSNTDVERVARFILRLCEQRSSPEYTLSPAASRLSEALGQGYQVAIEAADEGTSTDDNFSWLEHVPAEFQTEFLMDLLLATRRSRQSHDWSEVLQIIKHWKAIAEGHPPFEPVDFPEGILQGYDFSPEFVAEARKEMWAGFGKEPD